MYESQLYNLLDVGFIQLIDPIMLDVLANGFDEVSANVELSHYVYFQLEFCVNNPPAQYVVSCDNCVFRVCCLSNIHEQRSDSVASLRAN